MFSGIVEEVGRIAYIIPQGENIKIGIKGDLIFRGGKKKKIAVRDSIAVAGVCVTVEKIEGKIFSATLVPETMRKTNLGKKKKGDEVNLERALTLQEGISGHLVQGHVDGTGKVLFWNGKKLEVKVPDALQKYIFPKGSIALEGISLTVAGFSKGKLTVAIIPFTRAHTSLRSLEKGEEVNLEVDIVAKAVVHYLNKIRKKGELG